jgi:branched-chain amino acid transport system ATP-binding protein
MTLLEVEHIAAAYGPVQVIEDVSLSVPEGGSVGILGANGAGKTTTLRAISGTVRVPRGRIRFEGRDITGCRPEQVAALGIAHVPEGRGTLGKLTVRENLQVGAYLRKDAAQVRRDIDAILELFPNLRARMRVNVSALSGGEQQMLAIGRAIMARPKLLILDEPSLGLAPSTSQLVYDAIAQLRRDTSLSMLVVEQNANLAFRVVDSAVVLETGRSVLHGSTTELRNDVEVRKAYLGA